MTRFVVSPVLIVPFLAALGVLGVLAVAGRVPIKYNARNLLVRWPMTLLTCLAFTVVIALLTYLLAMVSGMAQLTEQSRHPANVIVMADGSTDESYSFLSIADIGNIDHEPGVAQGNEGKPLCSREVYILASTTIPPKGDDAAKSQTRGRIKCVRGDGTFVVTDDKAVDVVYHLAEKARVFVDAVASSLDFAKPGDLVWLAYETRGTDRLATEVRASGRQRFVQVRGVDDPLIAAEVHGLELQEGEWFSSAGVKRLQETEKGKEPETAVEAVLGEGVAKALGPDLNKPSLRVDDVFVLGPMKWKVVGILKASDTIFGSEIWAKRSYVGELYGKAYTVSSVTIRAESPEAAGRLAASLKDDFKQTKLNPQTEIDYYSKQRGFLTILLTAIVALKIFMALGGIFGVMNTMFAAISQRAKDIGVLRIVGYARWQILVSFVLESVLIAVVGGLLGCALGALGTIVSGGRMTSVIGGEGGFGKTVELRLLVTANTVVIGVLLSLIMGLLGGLLPGLAAMRLKPLEAMR
jgi:ABC-type antimicrobial peptide transport system permease subunit